MPLNPSYWTFKNQKKEEEDNLYYETAHPYFDYSWNTFNCFCMQNISPVSYDLHSGSSWRLLLYIQTFKNHPNTQDTQYRL